VAVALAGVQPAAPAAAHPSRAAVATTPAAADVTAAIPAVQAALGPRYGGYWIDERHTPGAVHVQVVGATAADRATVRSLTAGDPGVVTDSVAQSYDALVAAKDEIAATLAGSGRRFAAEVDPRRNAVVVTTTGEAAPTAGLARAAARRGAAQVARWHPAAPPAADIAAAVAVEPHASIALQPLGTSRNSFPPNEAGLGITIASGGLRFRCTTGYEFRNGFGMFGTTAGHCGRLRDGVAVGNTAMTDSIRMNGYQGHTTVRADVSAYSLTANRWPGRAVVHTQGAVHRRVVSRYTNAQITSGLRLCFDGITSDGGNCGAVVRTNSTICCDANHKTFVFDCINFASRPGDSGSPVYAPRADGAVTAAGALSSNVTINGQVLMCFSTIQNLEAYVGRMVTG
jgi:hypothetical protein